MHAVAPVSRLGGPRGPRRRGGRLTPGTSSSAASPGVPRRGARTPRCACSGGSGPCGHGYGHAHSAYLGRTWWWHTAGWLAAARPSPWLPHLCMTYSSQCLIFCHTSYCGVLLYSCHTLYKLRKTPSLSPPFVSYTISGCAAVLSAIGESMSSFVYDTMSSRVPWVSNVREDARRDT
jgi:hypothetical protein